MKKSTKNITAEEFDKKFDAGEDLSEYIDWSQASKMVIVDRLDATEIAATGGEKKAV